MRTWMSIAWASRDTLEVGQINKNRFDKLDSSEISARAMSLHRAVSKNGMLQYGTTGQRVSTPLHAHPPLGGSSTGF
jgi:hypothetical protein